MSISKGMEKSEKASCLKWQTEATRYPGYYLTEWQKKQCDHYGIEIDAPVVKPLWEVEGVVTAYNSEESQTDSSPFTTASNQRVRDGIIANNCLDFGTKVQVKGKTFEVQDRMNSRYDCSHFDIWLEDKQEAIEWGKQKLVIKIER